MIFRDGLRKAGFFQDNIYKTPLLTMREFDAYQNESNKKIPEAFR